MRGYLHGGIIIDLIGQKGPTSKIHLVLLDLLVLVLQCFMLAVHLERERLAAALAAFLKPRTNAGLPRAGAMASQNHDSEERGVMRDGVTDNGDIELQPMSSRIDGPSTRSNGGGTTEDEEHARLIGGSSHHDESQEDDNPLDLFWSGTAVVADFHVVDTLRNQWYDPGNVGAASALQTAGYSAELANQRSAAARQQFQRWLEGI